MKEDLEDELKALSPFLADLKSKGKKEESFKVPPLYFDTLADKIIEKAKEQEQAAHPLSKQAVYTPPKPSFWEQVNAWIDSVMQPRYAMGFATVLMVVGASWWFFNSKNTIPIAVADKALTEVSHDEIHQYIHENIDDFDEELILSNQDLADTEGSEEINLSDDDIQQYLEENIDEKDLKTLENKL